MPQALPVRGAVSSSFAVCTAGSTAPSPRVEKVQRKEPGIFNSKEKTGSAGHWKTLRGVFKTLTPSATTLFLPPESVPKARNTSEIVTWISDHK